MKTYKNLYPQICTFENLFLAYRAAARGKRGKAEVAAFERELEPNLFRLQEKLLTQTYQPGSYTHFPIRDPKPRIISAAPFRDRVVHHALVRVIEPIFERRFIHDSYACRVGKGTHRALDRCQEFARRYRYVLQCDLCHFFPFIDLAGSHGFAQCAEAAGEGHPVAPLQSALVGVDAKAQERSGPIVISTRWTSLSSGN
jgi:hypothetical protein